MPASLPSLHAMDLRFWFQEHPRCTKAAVVALAKIVEGQPPETIAKVAPDLDFLRHPKHLAALAQAGYLFTTLTVPDAVADDRRKHYARTKVISSKGPLTGDAVRKYAIYLDADESVHSLLDESGVPPVPKEEASRWGADVARGSWVNSLRHMHRLYPEEVERWASEGMVLASMAVETWVKKNHKAAATMVVDVVAWGMQVDKMRDHMKKTHPARVADFEALVVQGRAQRLEAVAPEGTPANKPLRL